MAPLCGLEKRQQIFDSATRIKQLSQHPSDFLTDLLVQQQQFACIEWIYRFNLLAKIPLPPGSISYYDAATILGVSEPTLRAAARMAMTANFLCETKDGRLAHNHLSASFVEDEGLAAWLTYVVKASVPCMRSFPEATRRWPQSTKRNEVAYNVAMGTSLSFFDHTKANPELSAEFDRYMKSQSTVHEGTSADHLLRGYAWASLGDAQVVDVGGNAGAISITLAREFPRLRFIVQDLAGPLKDGVGQLAALPADIAERIEFQEHDFFLPQPVKDADVYLLRMIIHDWSDDDAARILKEVAGVMKPGSRMLIMDMVLPIPGTVSVSLEAALRQKDLTMRQVMNAGEREVEDWKALVNKSDERLLIHAIWRPDGCLHSLIEILRSP